LCPLSDICTAANGIDALTTDHDPVKLFRWNKPTKQRGLIDEIVLLRRENTMKRMPDIEVMDQPMRVWSFATISAAM
jgi:hypothetical protein